MDNYILKFLKTHQELLAFSLKNYCSSLLLLLLMRNKVAYVNFKNTWSLNLFLDTRQCTCLLCTLRVFSLLETSINYWARCRVTCRDWFQLSLKEGLTVFRDQVGFIPVDDGYTNNFLVALANKVLEWFMQEFSSDLGSRPVKRIADVSKLRMYQFPQVQRLL